MARNFQLSHTGLALLVVTLLLPLAAGALDKTGEAIRWFSGNPDQAFAEAASQEKPVFLYWGASWCPPCNELKATLFQSPSFIEKTHFFIPVYLDGDTPNAQHSGEKFKVMGYPTLILFDKNGKEITRIPGGMNLEFYPDVLDMVLQNIQPAATLVARIMEQGYSPSSNDLRLLAHYAWQQDAGKVVGGRNAVSLLRALSDITPPDSMEIKSRFDAAYLHELVKAETPLGQADRNDAVKRLTRILADPVQARGNFEFVIHESRKVIEAVTETGTSERTRLASTWETSMEKLAGDNTLSAADRLNLHKGKLELLALRQAGIPDELKSKIAGDVNRALSNAGNIYERITVSYTGYGILQDSGQSGLARELLESELSRESNSSYWMLMLASMAKQDEHNAEALKWYRSAWESSQGAATRLQWGTYYIDNLTRLEPDNPERIEAVSQQILAELKQQQNPLYGRNKRGVIRIAEALSIWAESNNQQQVFVRLKTAFNDICASHFLIVKEQQSCSALFSGTEET